MVDLSEECKFNNMVIGLLHRNWRLWLCQEFLLCEFFAFLTFKKAIKAIILKTGLSEQNLSPASGWGHPHDVGAEQVPL